MKSIKYILALFLGLSMLSIKAQTDYSILFLQGDYDQILLESEKSMSSTSIYWRAQAFVKKGQFFEASRLLKEGRDLFPDDDMIEQQFIHLQYQLGSYSDVFPLLEVHLDKHEYFVKYVEILEFREQYRKAILLLQERMEKDSSNLEILRHLADNYIKNEQSLSAIQTLEAILSLHPNDLLSISKLSKLYTKILDYQSAIDLCMRGLEIDSLYLRLYRNLGVAYNKIGEYESSGKCFRILCEQGDSSVFVMKNLGITDFYANEYKASIKHLEYAYSLDREDFEICFVLGRSCYNDKQYDLGLKYFTIADSLLLPDHQMLAQIQIEKVQSLIQLLEYELAIESYLQAYSYDPKLEYIFFVASLYQHEVIEKKKALQYFEQFVSSLPEDTTENDGESSDPEFQRTISMREVAERNIEKLKEELFFEGKTEDLIP